LDILEFISSSEISTASSSFGFIPCASKSFKTASNCGSSSLLLAFALSSCSANLSTSKLTLLLFSFKLVNSSKILSLFSCNSAKLFPNSSICLFNSKSSASTFLISSSNCSFSFLEFSFAS